MNRKKFLQNSIIIGGAAVLMVECQVNEGVMKRLMVVVSIVIAPAVLIVFNNMASKNYLVNQTKNIIIEVGLEPCLSIHNTF